MTEKGYVAAIAAIIIIGTAIICACFIKEEKTPNNSFGGQFVVLEENESSGETVSIIYDRDTKVMYYYLSDGYNKCAMSPVYNQDGSVKVYDGE